MQIETAVGRHFTPTMATASKTGDQSASKNGQLPETASLGGMQGAVATLETVWQFLLQIQHLATREVNHCTLKYLHR